MFERIKVTEAQVIETLRAVVAERPDHVYNAPDHMRSEDNGNECFYVHVDANGESPEAGCVVGVVLDRLGVPLDQLEGWEATGADTVAPMVLETTSDIVALLGHVQYRQDHGKTWSEALAEAETYLPTSLRS